MSVNKPWVIAPDAVRAVSIVTSLEDIGHAIAGPAAPPPGGGPDPAWLVTVHLAGLTRTGWLDLDASPEKSSDGPGEYLVRLIPLLTVDSFDRGFTSCGWGWATSQAPLRDGERVEVTDGRPTVFPATVVGHSCSSGRWSRALLHVAHGDQATVPASVRAAVGPDTVSVDVAARDLLGDQTPTVGARVELLGPRTVRVGVVEELSTDPEPGWRVRLVDQVTRGDPTSAWTRPVPARPRLVPDHLEAVLGFDELAVGGWPVDGTLTTRMGDRNLPRTALGEPAMRVAEIAWRLLGSGPLTADQQRTVLQLAVMREADDRHLMVDWGAVRTWVDDDAVVVHGQFPLLAPVTARTPGSPT